MWVRSPPSVLKYIYIMKKHKRDINGYVAIYLPDHPKAMKSENWNGWIYEHIVVAEKAHGRELKEYEVVHHLDFDRSNNAPENLIILDQLGHLKLHAWIKRVMNIENIEKERELSKCETCGIFNKNRRANKCLSCYNKERKSKLKSISLCEILHKLKNRSTVSVAKEYNVSDNGLKKYIKKELNII